MIQCNLISIIIPSYNEIRNIKKTLDALEKAIKFYQEKSMTSIEVIISDDGSTDRSKDFVTNNFPWVSYFYHENIGRGLNRNYGAAHAKGDILVFFDADIFLEEDALWELLQPLSTNDQLGIYFGKCHLVTSDNPSPLERYLQLHWEKYMARFEEYKDPWDTYSTLFAIYSEQFHNLGGFSDKFAHYGGEDTEFFLRAHKNGALLYFINRAVGWHHRTFDLRSNLNRAYWGAYSSSLIEDRDFLLDERNDPLLQFSGTFVDNLFRFLTINKLWGRLRFLHFFISLLNIKGKFSNYFYTYLFREYRERGREDAREYLYSDT